MTSMKKSFFVFAALLATMPAGVLAAEAASPRTYEFQVRVCQVLTNVTGSGLTSQTLPGMNGWFQVVHQKLDDTELVMEGATLTWNGKPTPENPRIIELGAPSVSTPEGRPASIEVESCDPVQYMVKRADGLFELHYQAKDSVGLLLNFNPGSADKEGILTCDISFRYSWVKQREKIDGVNLEVGRPVLGLASTEGSVKMRVGEWSCYQAPVESEGWVFLFIRAEEKDGAAPSAASQEQSQEQQPGKSVDLTERERSTPAETKAAGPKVEAGGSVEVRGEFFSRGRK